MKSKRFGGLAPGLALALTLAGCGGGTSLPGLSASSGQVAGVSGSAAMTRFAAARAADQVSFGATPALTNAIAQQGLDSWVTAQMALPVSQMNPPDYVRVYDTDNETAKFAAYDWPINEFFRQALVAPDQLRLRVSWALIQYIPVNAKVSAYGMVQYHNLLQRHAFGNYGEFLRELTIHPSMGFFLDNAQNRPTSDQCTGCAPNENYARELMQLFTLGVVQLNADGTIKRNSQGRALETYTQEDVEELAGALTGWRFSTVGQPLPGSDWINAGNPMVAEEWEPLHDRNPKTIMGNSFPGGRSAPQELDAVVAMLMAHPNIGPFVSLRLIQHLVTSNPTPAYVGRVAAVFRNNGSGVAGDMKAVIRAILADTEARRGDVPGADTTRFGKFREPVLWYTGLLRGLGCTKNLLSPDGPWVFAPDPQFPFNPPNVFSYYMPTDRAPGSNLLAPEQKIVNARELTDRMGRVGYVFSRGGAGPAGCDADSLGRAYARSPKALIDEISLRWFRGAMPPTLRTNLQSLAVAQSFGSSVNDSAMVLTQYALTTPFYGVMK